MQVAKSTVGVGVKVLESGEKLIKKQANNFASGKIFHKGDSSPNSSPKLGATLREQPSNIPPEDTKAECICTYKKDLGKLIVTEKYLKFRSLHYDEIIHFDKVSSIRKKGPQKVVLKMKDDSSCSFGPFDDVRRGVIYDIIRTIFESYVNKKESGGKGGGININAIPGLSDQVVKDIFDKPNISEMANGTFKEPSDIDTPCIDEVFDIPLKNLFALVFTDSATFLTDLQTKQGDSGMNFSKWEYSEANTCYTRQFDFIKKNKLATATVHQTQLCRLKSPTELLFETSNKMEGVPFSDSFTVDTKWRVAQEGDKTRMKVWVRVDFKKSVSFIKGKIESGSISATQEYFKEYAEFLRRTLASGNGAAGALEEEKKLGVGAKSKSNLGMYLTITAMLLLIPLALYYLWGLFSYVNISSTTPDLGVDRTQAIDAILQSIQEQLAKQGQLELPANGSPDDQTIETLKSLQDSLVAQLQTTSNLLTKINEYLVQVAQQSVETNN